MTEYIEIRNETKKTIKVSACRSKLSGKLYIHFGKCHSYDRKVKPLYFEIIPIHEVEC